MRNELKTYQYHLVFHSKDLLNAYLYILNFEKQIVETKNDSERKEMLVTHRHLIDNLEGQRNSVRGILMQDEEIFAEYDEQQIEFHISKNMYDFNEDSSLETQKELIENLETEIEGFKEFIETIPYKEPEI